MNPTKQDTIFLSNPRNLGGFSFDNEVVEVFADMIQRSVPGYREVIGMTKVFAEQYSQKGTNLYDLGASLGAGALAMAQGATTEGTRIIAIDNSKPMVERCTANVKRARQQIPIDVVLGDITKTPIQNASLVAMNFTLQFLPPEIRPTLLKKIYHNLVPGGALILSEKIIFTDPKEQVFQEEAYHNFKELNGYSKTEISRKRKALENVLVPDTLETHFSRLEEIGFSPVYLWWKSLSFISLLAVKAPQEPHGVQKPQKPEASHISQSPQAHQTPHKPQGS